MLIRATPNSKSDWELVGSMTESEAGLSRICCALTYIANDEDLHQDLPDTLQSCKQLVRREKLNSSPNWRPAVAQIDVGMGRLLASLDITKCDAKTSGCFGEPMKLLILAWALLTS